MDRKRLIRVIIAIVISALVGGRLLHSKYPFTDRPLAGQGGQKPWGQRVVKVLDGDTVELTTGGRVERVRLIGIDAPEMGQGPWGGRAKGRLEEIISSTGMKVRVELDVEERDKYGRLLAYLWTSDGKMINLMMVDDGYALLFTFPPNVRHVDELRRAQASAREKKAGVWGKGGLREKPSHYRKRMRD